MKKTKIITTLAVSTIVLASLAPVSLATSENTTTEGKLIFETVGPGDEGTVVKPDTEAEIIVPEGGNHTTGPLRLTYVPDFDFGKVTLDSKNITASAKFNTFKETDPVTGQAVGDLKEIAHFAQVEDIRGKKGDWELTVKATKFIPAKTTNKPLDHSHIVLTQGKLFNTTKQSDIETRVEKLALPTAIPNDNKTSMLVMKTNPGQHTETSKTSVVFNNAYTAQDLVGGVPAPQPNKDRLNPGVQLKAYGTDEKAVDDTYTATLTWTLASTL